MTHEDIITYYDGLLSYVGFKTLDDSTRTIVNSFTNEPEVINNKPLVLPTKDNLRKDSHLKVYFHPLGEDVLKGESLVMEKIRNTFNLKINIAFAYLCLDLVEFALNPQDLNDEQLLMISDLNVNEKSINKISSIIRNINKLEVKDFYSHMYLKKNAKINGVNYLRASINTFQLYDLLVAAKTSEDYKSFPFKITKEDVEFMLSLYKTIFPLIDQKEVYNYGSNNRDFPYLESFIRGASALTERINEIVTLFEDKITDIDKVKFTTGNNVNILDYINMDKATKIIPVLEGNDGVKQIKDLEENKQSLVDVRQMANTSNRTVDVIPQQLQQPTQQPMQTVNNISDEDRFKAILNNGPYSPQVNNGMMQPNYPNMGYVPSPFTQPIYSGYPLQQPMQQPIIQPNMGYVPSPFTQPGYNGYPVQQPNTWMNNQNNMMGQPAFNGALNFPAPPNPFV